MIIIGWLGSVLLMLCGIPVLIDVVRKGTSKQYSLMFLLMWYFGELLSLVYVFYLRNIPLAFNYSFNVFILIIVLAYWSKDGNKA